MPSTWAILELAVAGIPIMGTGLVTVALSGNDNSRPFGLGFTLVGGWFVTHAVLSLTC